MNRHALIGAALSLASIAAPLHSEPSQGRARGKMTPVPDNEHTRQKGCSESLSRMLRKAKRRG